MNVRHQFHGRVYRRRGQNPEVFHRPAPACTNEREGQQAGGAGTNSNSGSPSSPTHNPQWRQGKEMVFLEAQRENQSGRHGPVQSQQPRPQTDPEKQENTSCPLIGQETRAGARQQAKASVSFGGVAFQRARNPASAATLAICQTQ